MSHARLRTASRRRAVLASALALTCVACTGPRTVVGDVDAPASEAPATAASDVSLEQPPRLPDDATRIDGDGGTFSRDGVTVDVSSGTVPEGHHLEIRLGEPVGALSSPFAEELAGRPVSVDHDVALRQAVGLSWHLPELSPAQRDAVVLAVWDDELGAWAASDVEPRWRGDTLTAAFSHFSVVTWITGNGGAISQAVGEGSGTRVVAPTCATGPLPGWVRQTVDPDESETAAAVRVCFEEDKAEGVTVRVANNRVFSQQMAMTGTDRWAWTWPGEPKYDPPAAVHTVAHAVFDDDRHYLLPPLATVAVSIGRPGEPGQHVVTAPSTVNAVTVFVDAVAFVFNRLPVGGTDNPAINALLQALYECGGKELLGKPDLNRPAVLVRTAVEAVAGCADEILRADSEFGTRFEQLSRDLIRKGGLGADEAVRANRFARQAASAAQVLTVGKFAFYASDQLANAAVGPLAWGIRGNGRPQTLGAWAASCKSVKDDSNRLYRNLALQDKFADADRELWQFDGWAAAATVAVEPATACGAPYRWGLAAHLAKSWADPKAARVVAQALTAGLAPPDAGQRPRPVLRLSLGGTFDDQTVFQPGSEAVAYVTKRLGKPTRDVAFRCGRRELGTGGRQVVWGPLRLEIQNEFVTEYASTPGPRVAGWSYVVDPQAEAAAAAAKDSIRLKTAEGVGVGSTLSQLQQAYPDGHSFRNLGTATFEVFRGDVSNLDFLLDGNNRVTAMTSGSGCPE